MDDKLVSFHKDGITVEIVVCPLRDDETVSIAKARIGINYPEFDSFLDSASVTISTPKRFC